MILSVSHFNGKRSSWKALLIGVGGAFADTKASVKENRDRSFSRQSTSKGMVIIATTRSGDRQTTYHVCFDDWHLG